MGYLRQSKTYYKYYPIVPAIQGNLKEKMGRETQEAIAVQSSVALLQQRFKELQRVKKERQEREFLKMMMMLPHDHRYEPFKFCNNPISSGPLPPKPPLVLSLSLWPNSQRNNSYGDDDHFNVPTPMKSLWPTEKLNIMARNNAFLSKLDEFDRHDVDNGVDTSLHL